MESQVSSERDLYQMLEVSRDAGDDAIKKAYRRLALQYHPDKTGGDPESTERFKEIKHAYEVLSNPEKRARYDRYGPAGIDSNGGGSGGADFGFGGFGPFADIFDVVFGAGARGAGAGARRGGGG